MLSQTPRSGADETKPELEYDSFPVPVSEFPDLMVGMGRAEPHSGGDIHFSRQLYGWV